MRKSPIATPLRGAAMIAAIVAGTLASTAGCGGSGSSNGIANILLMDAPSCGYDHVYVTVDHVEISTDGSAWTTIPVGAGVGRIDLLGLGNGTLLSLGQAPLPAGTYQQVRLVLKGNGGAAPWADSIVLTGTTTEIALTTPSGQQSGYKINGPFTVAAGTMADLVLDFNACKSIVVAGGSGKYLLKPVVSAVAAVVSGQISGTTVAGSSVYAEQQSSTGPVIVTGTIADAGTGAFTLGPLLATGAGGTGTVPASAIDVVIVPPPATSGTGYGTHIVQNVAVTAGATTNLGTLTALAAATIHPLSGTVKVAGSPGAANLVADQTVTSSARTYEIASTSTTTGAYSMPLAASGPWVAQYTAGVAAVFTKDTASTDAGVYAVTATDAAGTALTQSANLASGPQNLDFALTP